jgi:hypothetical protein
MTELTPDTLIFVRECLRTRQACDEQSECVGLVFAAVAGVFAGSVLALGVVEGIQAGRSL